MSNAPATCLLLSTQPLPNNKGKGYAEAFEVVQLDQA